MLMRFDSMLTYIKDAFSEYIFIGWKDAGPEFLKTIRAINYKRMQISSYIMVLFVLFFLWSDFMIDHLWDKRCLALFRILDLSFAVYTLLNIFVFNIKDATKNAGPFLRGYMWFFTFFLLIWAALIASVETSYTSGLPSYIIVVFIIASGIYMRFIDLIIQYVISFFVLYFAISYLNDGEAPLFPQYYAYLTLLPIALLISRVLYAARIKNYIVNKELNDANRSLKQARDNLDAKVKKRTKELHNAKEKAEESDRLKSVFLANISHEIRTPMNSIIGFSKLLRKGDLLQDKREEYVNIIIGRSNHLLRLIDDLIVFSKIEAQQVSIDVEDFELNAFFNELYSIYELKIEEDNKRLKLIVEQEEEKVYISTDKNKLFQILSNMLNNAIKFTEQGEIIFGYQVKSEEKKMLFYVKDTGIGIPEEKQLLVFERFRQLDETGTRKYEGTGLGMSISKGLVELLGGDIYIESEEGKGTSFYFTVPLANM